MSKRSKKYAQMIHQLEMTHYIKTANEMDVDEEYETTKKYIRKNKHQFGSICGPNIPKNYDIHQSIFFEYFLLTKYYI